MQRPRSPGRARDEASTRLLCAVLFVSACGQSANAPDAARAEASVADGATTMTLDAATVVDAGAATEGSTTTDVVPPTDARPGIWQNVTPAGIQLAAGWYNPEGYPAPGGNNFGAQNAVYDGSHPGTFYVGVTYQGLWKSVDYGSTWSLVPTIGRDGVHPGDGLMGSNPGPLESGRPALAIAADGSYLLAPLLYPVNGYRNGAWKSTDGGVHWTRYAVGEANGDDIGSFAAHPTDPSRVLATGHSSGHLYESHDGGQTWSDMGLPGPSGGAVAWLDDDHLIAIYGAGGAGPYRGTRSGAVWPWTWSWTPTGYSQQGAHGGNQPFVDRVHTVAGQNVVYLGGLEGLARSTDDGQSFSVLFGPGVAGATVQFSGGIVATPTTLYSSANYANNTTGFPASLAHAPRVPGTAWVADAVPAGMTNGWLGAAVAFDGAHWIIVGGHWNAGIWRYVEP